MAQNQIVRYNNNNNPGSFVSRAAATGIAAGALAYAKSLYDKYGPGKGIKIPVNPHFRTGPNNAWRRWEKYRSSAHYPHKYFRTWKDSSRPDSFLSFLRSRRRRRYRRFRRRFRAWARNKSTRRRLGVTALVNRPIHDIGNQIKYRSSLTQNFPPASLTFYPSSYGRQIDVADSSGNTIPVLACNGWYRFDFAIVNVPPYWYNPGGELQNRYWPLPIVSCLYYEPDKWFNLDGSNKSDGRFYSYWSSKPPPGKTVYDVMYKYKYCKLRRLRVGIEICHGYKNELITTLPLINDQAPVGNGISTIGSSSQKCKLYCTHFKSDFNLEHMAGLQGEGRVEEELGKLFSYENDILAVTARPKDAANTPCLLPTADMIKASPYIYSSGSIVRRRSLRFSPKLRRIKFDSQPKQFKPFFGNNIKTLGPENQSDYSFPSAVNSDVYHYTLMYIPGETSYVGICSPNAMDAVVPSQLPAAGGAKNCKECPYKACPVNLGWPDLTVADTTRQTPPSLFAENPALKFHVYYELIYWGPRSGNISADSKSIVTIVDGKVVENKETTE